MCPRPVGMLEEEVLNATTGMSPIPTVAWLQPPCSGPGWRVDRGAPGGLGLEEPPGCLQADALPH